MAGIKEKHTTHRVFSELTFEENKAKAFARKNEIESSYRVYGDGKVGIYYQRRGERLCNCQRSSCPGRR